MAIPTSLKLPRTGGLFVNIVATIVLICVLELSGTSIVHALASTTTAPATTANMTTTPASEGTTTKASNSTTSEMTTSVTPATMTTGAGNLTTSTSNMTTSTSNMTTSMSNMTTSASNMTTSTSNMTTSTSNMTTPVTTANMTTPHTGNVTTIPPGNSTTSSRNMTTPEPTPTADARWHVRDQGGMLCMLMDFNATLTYYPKKGAKISTWIPEVVSINKSTCDSSESKFFLEFTTSENIWQFGLNFTTKGNTYTWTRMTVILYKVGGAPIANDFVAMDVSVPVGSYYSCDTFNRTVSGFLVNMTGPHFQPFVQQTASRNDLGKEFTCGSKLPSAANVNVKIAVGVVVSVVVIAAAIAMTFFFMKRRESTQGPPYASLT